MCRLPHHSPPHQRGRTLLVGIAVMALAFVCEGAGKTAVEWQPTVVTFGGTRLSIPVGGKGSIYGYASFGAGKGIVIFRNSSDETQTFAEPLWKVLDLPEAQAKRQVKSRKVVYSHDAELGDVKSLKDVLTARLAPYGVVLVEFAM